MKYYFIALLVLITLRVEAQKIIGNTLSGSTQFYIARKGVKAGITDGSGDLVLTFAAMPDTTYVVAALSQALGYAVATTHTKTTTSCKVRFYNAFAGGVVPGMPVITDFFIFDY